MLRSMKESIKPQFVQVSTVTASINYASVEVKAELALMFLVAVENFAFDGSNKINFALEDSDDNITFAAAETAVSVLVDTVGEGDSVHKLEYKNNKKYVRVASTVTGTVSVPVAVIALLKPEVSQ